MISNDLVYTRELIKMGKPIVPYEAMYPYNRWVNLSDRCADIGTYGMLSPSRTLHPLTSIFGFTYFNLTSVALAQKLVSVEERVAAMGTDQPTDFTVLEMKPAEERKSVVPLIHLLLFERYVRDITFRRAVRKAVDDDLNFDLYRRRKNGVTVSSYFSCWYPELINNLVHMDVTGEVHDFLSNEKDGDRWYLPFLLCSEEEFLENYKVLMDEFNCIYHNPIQGKYWTLVD